MNTMNGKTSRTMLVSGYNQGPSAPGIHVFEIADDGKKSTETAQVSGVESPSYCILEGERIYAASESPDHGGFASYTLKGIVPSWDKTVDFPHAAGTCYTLFHPQGPVLYGADYNSGSVSYCALDGAGDPAEPVTLIQHEGHGAGRKQGDPYCDRQCTAHVHTLSIVPGTTMVAAVDLGLDMIVVYETDFTGRIIDASAPTVVNQWPDDLQFSSTSMDLRTAYGQTVARTSTTVLTEAEASDADGHTRVRIVRTPSNGEAPCVAELPVRPAAIVEAPLYAGPRIIAYHPNQRVAALICEIGCEVILFKISEDGLHWDAFARWDLLEGAKAIEDVSYEPPRAAHCQFTQNGRFLFTSTRGTDMMTTFALDEDCDLIDRFNCPTGGRTPRHFALSPDDAWLSVGNKTTNDVSLFSVDGSTGKLEKLQSIQCEAPSCILWE